MSILNDLDWVGILDEGKTERLPGPKTLETEWAPEMRAFLTKLMNANVEFPTRQIAGMTDIEKQGQGVLGDILSGKTFQDPRTSPMWQGYRQESSAEEEKGLSRLKRRAQGQGMFSSGGATRAEGDYSADMANQRLSFLGSMYEKERARDNPYTRLGAVSDYGGLPRQIEQQGYDASQTSATQNLMFPYQQQAPIANSMLGYQPWYQPQFMQNPSELTQLMNMLGPMMEGFGSIYGGRA